ncbi:MAG: structural protein [Gammaproteobacteria bacterium]
MIQPRFRSLLLEALKEFQDRGQWSEGELQSWLLRLHAALELDLPADDQIRRDLSTWLGKVFHRDVYGRGIAKRVPGVSRYTLSRIAPSLRAELDRRIFAGVDLIKLNKRAATQKTLQRFSGWVTSQPTGGLPPRNIREVAAEIAKPAAQVRYEARRVAIDQGHKLSSAVAHVVAMNEGAVAAIWHDRGQYDRGYDARPEHLKRSGKLFLVRGSQAIEDGLVKRGGPYTDEVTQPAFEIFCSCWWQFVKSARALPDELLTEKGRAQLKGVAV